MLPDEKMTGCGGIYTIPAAAGFSVYDECIIKKNRNEYRFINSSFYLCCVQLIG